MSTPGVARPGSGAAGQSPGGPRQPTRTREQAARRRRTYRRRRLVAGVSFLVLLGGAYTVVQLVLSSVSGFDVEVIGSGKGRLVNREAAKDLVIRVPDGATSIRFDGVDVTSAARKVGEGRELRPGAIAEGKHTVSVTVRRSMRPDQKETVSFIADLTPPALEVARLDPVATKSPATITGTAERGATITVDGRSVTVARDAFSVELKPPAPPTTMVKAVDRAGNVTESLVRISTVQPTVRAVHLTEIAWVTPVLKDPAMAMLDAKKIDTIQLDIKDEGGEVGYATKVQLARDIGSVHDRFVLEDAVKEIHERGGRVIGRIVAYRDPRLAQVSWEGGHKERVVLTPSGDRFGAYGGGFLNPNDATVRQYTNDLALEAVAAGVDEILLDYVRRPDGSLGGMQFPGIEATSESAEEQAIEDVIVDHLEDLHGKVRAAGGRLGASVYGIAATRPDEIAQDVTRMAEHLDYVAPMIYPSHWGKGEFGLADPNRQPGETIRRSLAAFGQRIEGSGAGLVPWLQDFSLGVTYGTTEVKAQIDAALDTGADGFLLWDAACTYTEPALVPSGAPPSDGGT